MHNKIQKLNENFLNRALKHDLNSFTIEHNHISLISDEYKSIYNITKNDTDKRLKYTFGVNQYEFPDKIKVLKCHNQIKELHTVLRDRETSHSDFKFYSDRLVGKKAKENKYSILYYHKFLKSNLLD